MTGASGLTDSRAWTYDLDGNRLTAVTGTSTDTFTYDRTDQLLTVHRDAGSSVGFAYDAFGNVTTNAESISAITAMTYDAASRLLTIDPSGTANDTTFAYDGLARIKTRVINGTTDTYRYAGTSEAVAEIATGGGSTVDSLVDVAGTRMAVKSGATLNWILPDLHGNVAGQLDSAGTSIAYATRYDPWGEVIDTGPGANTGTAGKTWTYQGRLDVSPSGINQPLLDGGARMYSPALGTFTSLDSVMGSAQDPLSMNRYLYAEANPSTFIDPTGHNCMRWIDDFCADKGVSSAAVTKHNNNVGASTRTTNSNRIKDKSTNPTRAWFQAYSAILAAARKSRDTADRDARESGAILSSSRLTEAASAGRGTVTAGSPLSTDLGSILSNAGVIIGGSIDYGSVRAGQFGDSILADAARYQDRFDALREFLYERKLPSNVFKNILARASRYLGSAEVAASAARLVGPIRNLGNSWKSLGRTLGIVGGLMSFMGGAVDQYENDQGSGVDPFTGAGRMAVRGGLNAGGSVGGSGLGVLIGGACPPPSEIACMPAFGVIGGLAGGQVGDSIADLWLGKGNQEP